MKRAGEREEEALVFVFALCQPRATIVLVNRNILVRQGTSLSCVYISCCIAWSLFLSWAAGLRDAHIRSASYRMRSQLAALMGCWVHSKN